MIWERPRLSISLFIDFHKVSVTEKQLQMLLAAGEILAINDIYGIRYGTPKQPIKNAFESDKFPLLDWPIKRLQVMEEEFGEQLYRVYIEPPSISELKRRLGTDSRDEGGHRLLAAIKELELLQCGELSGKYEMLVKANGDVTVIAEQIYSAYLKSLSH